MITARSTNKPYCTTISNDVQTILSDIAKEPSGESNAFRPHELLCAGYALCFPIMLCKLLDREQIPYQSVTARVDLDRTQEEKTKFLYSSL